MVHVQRARLVPPYGQQLSISHDPETGVLTVVGTVIGNIQYVTPSTFGSSGLKKGFDKEAFQVLKHQEQVSKIQKGVENLLTDVSKFSFGAHLALTARLGEEKASEMLATGHVWKTVSGGLSFREVPPDLFKQANQNQPEDYSLVEKFRCKYMELPVQRKWEHLVPTVPLLPAEFDRAAVKATALIATKIPAGSTFLTTDTGYIARAPHAVQEGDLLCILFGCRLPTILRPCGDTYELISFTYTDGIMDGEFVEDIEGVERREFRLR